MVEEKIKICDVCNTNSNNSISRAIVSCCICKKDLCAECMKLIIISIFNKGVQLSTCPTCQYKCRKGVEKGEFFTQDEKDLFLERIKSMVALESIEEKDKGGETIIDEANTIPTKEIKYPHPYLIQDYHQLKRQKQRGIYTSPNGEFTYTKRNK